MNHVRLDLITLKTSTLDLIMLLVDLLVYAQEWPEEGRG